MASLLRDVEAARRIGADHAVLANADVVPRARAPEAALRGERGVQAFQRRSTRALVALERNAGVKLVADWLVLQL